MIKQILLLVVAAFAEITPSALGKEQIFLGPPNPGAEQQRDDWNHGASGNGYLSYDGTDPAIGMHDFTLGNTNPDRGSHADWRSKSFPLGSAAAGRNPITFSFSYKLTDKVNEQDNIRVQLRFCDKANKFFAEKEFLLGSASQDSEMSAYKKMTIAGIRAPERAQGVCVAFNANSLKTATGHQEPPDLMTSP